MEKKDMDFFANLPREITMNILSRLPIRSIIKSKLVRRAFRDMLNSRDFRLPKSNPRLILSRFPRSTFYRICEINGRDAAPELVVELPLPGTEAAHASVDGLIFIVCKVLPRFIIRNPITREFFKLSAPFGQSYSYDAEKYKFGFGVSGASRRYKVVRICGSECLVYTLGSGRWRAVEAAVGAGAVAPPLLRSRCEWFSEPAFLGGKLHWLDSETNVICFDLETEVLTYFSAPPHQHRSKDDRCFRRVSALDDCLCLTELRGGAASDDVEIDIWFMRNGRDWSKERVIVWEGHGSYIFHCFPVKVFEDGDVLLWAEPMMRYCKAEGGGRCRLTHSYSHRYGYVHGHLFTPSFLRLKALFPEEDVRLFPEEDDPFCSLLQATLI